MAFFGTAWAGIGIGGLQGWGTPLLPIIAVCIGVLLFIAGIALIRSSRDLSNYSSKTDINQSRRIKLGFNITFGAEFVVIAVAGAVLSRTDHFEYFFPVMALIVGIHFFPLAYLFRVRIYYVTGTLLCLLAIMTLLIVPLKVTFGQHELIGWSSLVGFGSALILWITGIAIWLMGRTMLKMAR